MIYSFFLRIINQRKIKQAYTRGRAGIQLIDFTPPHLCACSKPEPAFPMSLSSFQWVNMIGDCSICWYCSNWWSSLFNLSFHSYIRGPLHTLIAKSDKLLPLLWNNVDIFLKCDIVITDSSWLVRNILRFPKYGQCL